MEHLGVIYTQGFLLYIQNGGELFARFLNHHQSTVVTVQTWDKSGKDISPESFVLGKTRESLRMTCHDLTHRKNRSGKQEKSNY